MTAELLARVGTYSRAEWEWPLLDNRSPFPGLLWLARRSLLLAPLDRRRRGACSDATSIGAGAESLVGPLIRVKRSLRECFGR